MNQNKYLSLLNLRNLFPSDTLSFIWFKLFVIFKFLSSFVVVTKWKWDAVCIFIALKTVWQNSAKLLYICLISCSNLDMKTFTQIFTKRSALKIYNLMFVVVYNNTVRLIKFQGNVINMVILGYTIDGITKKSHKLSFMKFKMNEKCSKS